MLEAPAKAPGEAREGFFEPAILPPAIVEPGSAPADSLLPAFPDSDPLVAEARAFARAARAGSTLRAYRGDWDHFRGWCEGREAPSLPSTPQTVALYLAALARTHRPGTITRRLTAITRAHRTAGHPTPASMDHPEIRETLHGIRRTLGLAQRRVAALRTPALRKALAALEPGLAGLRDRALLLLGFAGALRRANLAALALSDLAWSNEGVAVTLRRSKTDQAGEGAVLAIARGRRPETCPVLALQSWIAAARITEGPLFRAVDRNGRVRARALHPYSVALIVKRALASAGYASEEYAGHSLRSGFATEAARAGATVWDIMRQTGHRSPETVARYIREAELFHDTASGRLGL